MGERKPDLLINDVSDTALWVAAYRAMENERPDAIFQDPYAARLSGEKGRKIAELMKSSARYTSWSVVIRTYIIDTYIQNLIREGVDTVVNLGAGLDSRPYRMKLPAELNWYEVDYPGMIERKKKILEGDKPQCQLERISMDLANRELRQSFFKDINANSKKVLILTEGVVPYLTTEQAATLAQDLRAHENFKFWIVDYFSPKVYKYMKEKKRSEKMKNAPVVFYPEDWFGFFDQQGWTPKEIRYQMEESLKLGRSTPTPWFIKMLRPLMPAHIRQDFNRMTGYVLLVPK